VGSRKKGKKRTQSRIQADAGFQPGIGVLPEELNDRGPVKAGGFPETDPRLPGWTAEAPARHRRPSGLTVRANRFLLLGDEGEVRAVMFSGRESVMLSMFDRAGNLRVGLNARA
jgi:hypothetical protein